MAKKKLSALGLILKKLAKLAMATFATKTELAAVGTANVTDVSQSTAAAIWSNYTFATTDNDQAQQNEQSGESGNE